MRANNCTLTHQELIKILSYDSNTGEFFWIKDTGFKKMINKKAGCVTNKGYIAIGIFKTTYQAHRLAYFYVYGTYPINEIDHIDGNKLNNRINNLREVSGKLNRQNIRKPKLSNTTGFLGVTKRESGSFKAQISVNGRTKTLGTFKDIEDAKSAYLIAKRKLHDGCTI